jgi:hypothetical protein
MAYDKEYLTLIGYGSGVKTYVYKSADTAASIIADTDYFDEQIADFNVGDVIIIVDTTTPIVDLAMVATVATDDSTCLLVNGT